MDRLLFEAEKPVTLEANSEFHHLLEQVVQAAVPDGSIQNRILLCLSEAVTNLVIHAKPKASRITLRFGRNSIGWWLDILDDGDPWDPTEYKHTDVLSNFDLTENGRGAALLHTQCEQLEYNAKDDSELNRLRLVWTTPQQQQRPTILIVEDDNSLRQIYTIYLSDNFEVQTASNGHEALKLLTTNKVDLVLSDINMPEMSGLELRKELNHKSGTDIIPFIFLTAFGNTQMQKRATQLGIDDYLIKPINKIELIRTIHRVLERSRQIYQQLTERIDKSITSALTPDLPSDSHGWKLSIASRNTGNGGGDLLLYKSNEANLQLAVADIMGHDDSAKFFAHACGGYLHGLLQSHENEGNSAHLLEHLSNFAMKDKLLSKVTLTCCSAVLSHDGKINLSSAGHPPPLRISKKGIETMQVGGIMPGLLHNTCYQAKTLQLEVGERIAIYTDGLFESAEDEKQRAHLENSITLALIDTLTTPIEQALNKVMDVFDCITASKPKDDVLLLLIERDCYV
jgi:DNA-binding response OmpR family regulator/anti-sigma regulatory factor (Ser/Thr protein kinase)